MNTHGSNLGSTLTGSEQVSTSTLADDSSQQSDVAYNKTEQKQQAPSISDTEQQDTASTEDPSPNGGIQAWLQVLASFMFFMNSWGLINTFGDFQTYYKMAFLMDVSNSYIAWIGSIRTFILLASPTLYGPFFDFGHVHVLAAYGAFMVVFGIMMTSLCTSFWQIMLAQGIVVGLGSGALFLIAVAIVPTWFTTKKSLAMGIAASGSSIGGVIYPIVFTYLQPQLGFPWAVRVIGFITLTTNTLGCLVVKMRHKPEKRRSLFDANLFKDPVFVLWSFAYFFGIMGLYIPSFFIQEYAIKVLHQPISSAFWTLATINAASVFGRVIPGLIADKLNNPILVISVCTVATTILAWAWLAIRSSSAGLFVFCALYGFFSGAFVSLSTPATVSLAPSMKGIGTRLGVFNGVGSLGSLIGNPVAGAIVEKSWFDMQIFCGIACMCSLVLLGSVLGRSMGWKWLENRREINGK